MLFITKMCIYATMLFQSETFSEPCQTLPYPCTNEYTTYWELVDYPSGAEPFILGEEYVFSDTGMYVFNQIAQVTDEGNSWSGTLVSDTIFIGLPPDIYLDNYVICEGDGFFPKKDTDILDGVEWDTIPSEDTYYKVVTTNEYCSHEEDFFVEVIPCEEKTLFEYDPDNQGVYLPNSFSPNGNGINDVYEIVIPDNAQIIEFSVYDRWGRYVTSEYPWTGIDCPIGAYAVTVCVENNGKKMNFIQSVILIR